MKYIHIKKLSKYHPGYIDRKLKWAMIYFDMVQGDPDFELIESEIDKWRYVAMICLELQAQKPLPISDAYFRRKGFDLKKRRMSSTLRMLQGFTQVVTADGKLCGTELYKEELYKEDKIRGFVPPELSEVKDYCLRKQYDISLAAKFINYYGSNGWKVGKNKMVDWHKALAGWVARDNPKEEMTGYCPNQECNSYNQDRIMYKETDKCVYCGWELKGRV